MDMRSKSTESGEAAFRGTRIRIAFWLVAVGTVGTLGIGTAIWFMWGSQRHLLEQPPSAAVISPSVELNAVSAPVAATVQRAVPLIESVLPGPVMVNGDEQIFTIQGNNFAADARVILRNVKEPDIFKDVSIRKRTATQIVFKSSISSKPGRWMVEVHNPDGSSSDQYIFTVQVPTIAHTHSLEQAVNNAESTLSQGDINKQSTLSSTQRAEKEFLRAYQLMQQGHTTEALAGYEAALAIDQSNDLARQTMVSLLLKEKRNADAERVLQEGLENNPKQSSFAMLLARLQVGRNATAQALDTLLRTMPYTELQPDYQSFVAALLQRQGRHSEAIEHYQKALQLKPQSGVWLIGLGISLREEKRNADAREAFKRALDSKTLNTVLQAYVAQQLKTL